MVSPHRHHLSLSHSFDRPLSLLAFADAAMAAWFSPKRVTVEGRPVYDAFNNISSIVCAEWAKVNGQSPPPECAAHLAA